MEAGLSRELEADLIHANALQGANGKGTQPQHATTAGITDHLGVVSFYWPGFVLLTLLGAALASWVHGGKETTYSTSARILIDASRPLTPTEAAAIADGARAIVSSRGHLAAAIAKADVPRGVAETSSMVNLQPLGSSGIVELRVRDQDAGVAARLANALAEDLVQWESQAPTGIDPSGSAVQGLDSRIAEIVSGISSIDARLTELQTPRPSTALAVSVLSGQRSALSEERIALQSQWSQAQLAAGLDPVQRTAILAEVDQRTKSVQGQLNALDSRIDALTKQPSEADPSVTASILSARRSNLVEEKLALQSQQASSSGVGRRRALVIDPAAAPAQPEPRRLLQDAALGGIAGLAIAGLLVAVVEAFSPSVTGAAHAARVLGAPLLGTIRRKMPEQALWDMNGIGPRLQAAAYRFGVSHVELVPAGTERDLLPLADRLEHWPRADLKSEALLIHTPGAGLRGHGCGFPCSAGIAVVVFGRMKKSDLEPIMELSWVAGWPILGVIQCRGKLTPLPLHSLMGTVRLRPLELSR